MPGTHSAKEMLSGFPTGQGRCEVFPVEQSLDIFQCFICTSKPMQKDLYLNKLFVVGACSRGKNSGSRKVRLGFVEMSY